VTTSAPSLPVRFELRTGRMGSYFYDTRVKEDVDLPTALRYLNAYTHYVDREVKQITDAIERSGPQYDGYYCEGCGKELHPVENHEIGVCGTCHPDEFDKKVEELK